MMFLVTTADGPAVVITNDTDGPRDQATLVEWFGAENVQRMGGDVTRSPFPVYDSLDAFMRGRFNVRLDK